MQFKHPIYAVIVAGGQGTRMGNAIPKQFLEIGGKSILYYTINAFLEALHEVHLVLVLPQQQISYGQMVLQSFSERIEITIVAGGSTRFQSVKNGLALVPEDAIVLVHDGVRPLISKELIFRCIHQAEEYGSAVPAIAVADSMRVIQNEQSKPIDRNTLRIIQTPQTFKSSILVPAYQQEFKEIFTDEATVVEAYGRTIYLVEGERNNIKITTPEDMVIVEAIIKEKRKKV